MVEVIKFGKFNSFGKEVVVEVRDDNSFTTSLSKRVYHCNEYVIVHLYDEKGELVKSKLKTASEVLDMLLYMLPNFKNEATLISVLDLFESKVTVSPSTSVGYYGNPAVHTDIFGNDCFDKVQYQVMKENRIGAIGVRPVTAQDLAKYDGVKSLGDYVFCQSVINGEDIKVAFDALGLPVIPDKQVNSYLTYGAGVNATFSSLVGDRLVSAMPIGTDTTKDIKRLGSNSASVAVDPAAVHTNLKIRNLDGSFTSYVGAPKLTVIALDKQFNNGSGTILSNMGKIEHIIPKTLSKELVADELGKDRFCSLAGSTREEKLETLIEIVKEYLATQNGLVLKPGEDLTWSVEGEEDIVLATNNNNFEVVVQQKHLRVSMGKPTYRGKVRSIVVNVATKAHEFRYNLKARNGLTKGMTHMKPIELRCEGELVEEWDMILSPETNKGAINTLSAFASRFIDVEAGTDVKVVFDAETGTLDFDGEDVSKVCDRYLGFASDTVEEAYAEYVRRNTKSFTVKEVVAEGVVEKFKDFTNDKVQFVNENGVWYLIETFNAIFDYTFPLWEVSTPAECAGTNRIGVDDQAVLSLYDPGVKAELEKKLSKSSENLAMFEVNEDDTFAKVDAEFDITNDRNELVKFISRGDNEVSPKASVGALVHGGNNTIRVVNGSDHIDIPLGVILRCGQWSTKGYPTCGFTPIHEDEETGEETNSITASLLVLLDTIRTSSNGALAEIFSNWRYVLGGFIASIRKSKAINNYMKVGKQGHFKVITDYAVPMSHTRKNRKGVKTYNLPEVWVSPDFWGLKDNQPDGSKRSSWLNLIKNDVVILNRVPVATSVACVLVVKEDLDLDPCVFMVNPITWSQSTLGDADGDYGYITPVIQFGIKGYAKAECWNKHMLSLGGHDIACSRHGSVSPVYDFIGASSPDVSTWKSDTAKFVAKNTARLTCIKNSMEYGSFQGDMVSVSNHYKISVGETYKYYSHSLRATVDHFHNGNPLTDEMWIEVGNKLYVYEQNSLGGWSIESAARIAKEVETVKKFIKADREFRFVKGHVYTKGRLGSRNPSADAFIYINWVCASVILCERYTKYNRAATTEEVHVLAYALRMLSRNSAGRLNREIYRKLSTLISNKSMNKSMFAPIILSGLKVRG